MAKPKQTIQTEPNPEHQAALTADLDDRQEVHVVEQQVPDGGALRSAEAPGIRTEPEVVADHVADNERAAAALAANPHTADPAFSTSSTKLPRVENRDRAVYFRRVGGPPGADFDTVQGVNEGTAEHGILLADPDFEETSRPTDPDSRAGAAGAGDKNGGKG